MLLIHPDGSAEHLPTIENVAGFGQLTDNSTGTDYTTLTLTSRLVLLCPRHSISGLPNLAAQTLTRRFLSTTSPLCGDVVVAAQRHTVLGALSPEQSKMIRSVLYRP